MTDFATITTISVHEETDLQTLWIPMGIKKAKAQSVSRVQIEKVEQVKLRKGKLILVEGQECMSIALSRSMFAIVDLADAEMVLKHNWCAIPHSDGPNTIWYASRKLKLTEPRFTRGQTVTLHQFLAQGQQDVDHRNSNGLDCRRCNLRFANDSQNQGNSRLRKDNKTGFKGVSWIPPHRNTRGRFTAHIMDFGILRHLGSFQDPVEAAKAYNAAALAKWGEFARLNPIPQTNTTKEIQCQTSMN